jgi:hypothetical protein
MSNNEIIKHDYCCPMPNNKNIIEILDLFNSKYYCKICRQKLRTKADELIHLNYKHCKIQTAKIICLYCSIEFQTYYNLKKHLMIKHLNERPYGCKICKNKNYTQFINLKIHIKKHHKNENIKKFITYSNSILETNNNKQQQQIQKIKKEEEEIYEINIKLNCLKCKLCSKICLTEANYLVHKWEHLINNNRSYLLCWHCKTLKFNSYYDLEIHLHTKHLNELSYECSTCSQQFYDWNLTKLHLTKAHLNITNVKFNCKFCNNLFTTHKDIVFHTLRCHNNNQVAVYKCSLCDDKLNSKALLNLHLQQHEFIVNLNKPAAVIIKPPPPVVKRGSLSLICQLCGYEFENSFFLNQHKSLHLSENLKRQFKCHLCQVTFSKTEQLLRHMIVHQANELDFVCKVCYSTFSRKQDLDRHMNFHVK